jgi:SAM-dependent methyltransferase
VLPIKKNLIRLLRFNVNEAGRDEWLKKTLRTVPAGHRILDAGAGELRNKPHCMHLAYISQDVCQYEGTGDAKGLQTGKWDTSKIDLVCDIANIPEPDASFDAILCSEVLEHVPDAVAVLNQFQRLLKSGGTLILTAPFASFVHFAPYHFASGFSRYWYEYHLPLKGFDVQELSPNGDWFGFLRQEMLRLPQMAKRYGDWCWPFAYVVAGFGLLYFSLRIKSRAADDLACFGWHCVARKR